MMLPSLFCAVPSSDFDGFENGSDQNNENNDCVTIRDSEVSFILQNVPGDGNCFISCISMMLIGDHSFAANVRLMICQNIFDNWLLWEELVLGMSFCGNER